MKNTGVLPTHDAVTGKSTTYDDDEDYTFNPFDTIGMYFRDVGKHPLLTSENELALAKTLSNGRTFEGNIRTLETLHLTDEAHDAMNTLINSNLRLVISRAKLSLGRGTPFLDCIEAGNIGLMKGIAKFNWERGYRLSTYCTWWIDQSIGREIRNFGHTIRIPVHFYDWIQYVKGEQDSLSQQLGRKPTIDELAEAVGSDPTYLNEALKISDVPASLNRSLDGEDPDSEELGDRIADSQLSFEETVERDATRELMREAYLNLPDEREQAIIGLRFGFIDGEPHTLEEVGVMLHITRERIRQIEHQALGKVRTFIILRVRRINIKDLYDN